jgi:hypothetical protein
MKALFYGAGAIVALHGLVHLMGFVAYWPLAPVAELPYKTALFGGEWDVGRAGMKLFGLLWLVAALGFVASAAGLLAGQMVWRPLMIGTVILSTAVIALDWAPAFRGAVVNGAIVILMGLAYWFPNLLSPR